jgi:hypothetical protein
MNVTTLKDGTKLLHKAGKAYVLLCACNRRFSDQFEFKHMFPLYLDHCDFPTLSVRACPKCDNLYWYIHSMTKKPTRKQIVEDICVNPGT